MPTGMRDEQERFGKARPGVRELAMKHPVLYVTFTAAVIFAGVTVRVYGRRGSHGWPVFLWAAVAALIVAGTGAWLIWRARRTGGRRS